MQEFFDGMFASNTLANDLGWQRWSKKEQGPFPLCLAFLFVNLAGTRKSSFLDVAGAPSQQPGSGVRRAGDRWPTGELLWALQGLSV